MLGCGPHRGKSNELTRDQAEPEMGVGISTPGEIRCTDTVVAEIGSRDDAGAKGEAR